jgi:hypothetical protein
VHVRAEDEELLREILEVLLHPDIALQRGDLLSHPIGEGMRAGGSDLEPALRGEIDDRAAQPHQLRAKIRWTSAHLAPDFDHRLVQLGLHFFEDQVIALEDLRDVRPELACGGVDDLVLFFDAEGEAWGAHVETGLRAERRVG